MRSVEMPEAESQFPALLEEVERGGQITITREGKAVARLMPSLKDNVMQGAQEQRLRAREALVDMAELRAELKLGPFDWEAYKADRDAGRR
jgi:prevent-host-death family protein